MMPIPQFHTTRLKEDFKTEILMDYYLPKSSNFPELLKMNTKPVIEVLAAKHSIKELFEKFGGGDTIAPLVCTTIVLRLLKDQILYRKEVWTSFNHQISEAAEAAGVHLGLYKTEFPPLYQVKEAEDLIGCTASAYSETGARELLFCSLMAPRYFASKEKTDEYSNKIVNRMKTGALSNPFELKSDIFAVKMKKYEGVITNDNFLRAHAIVDMFLYQDKKHAYSKLRLGTCTARYRDMAAIGDWETFAGYAGDPSLNTDVPFDRIFNDEIMDEMDRMMKPEQEQSMEESYLPYSKSMNLINFLCDPEPNMGKQRSYNAVDVSGANESNIILAAKWVAVAFGMAGDFRWMHKSIVKVLKDDGSETTRDIELEAVLRELADMADEKAAKEGEDISVEDVDSVTELIIFKEEETEKYSAKMTEAEFRDSSPGKQAYKWYLYSLRFEGQRLPDCIESKLKLVAKRVGTRQGSIGKRLADSFA